MRTKYDSISEEARQKEIDDAWREFESSPFFNDSIINSGQCHDIELEFDCDVAILRFMSQIATDDYAIDGRGEYYWNLLIKSDSDFAMMKLRIEDIDIRHIFKKEEQ